MKIIAALICIFVILPVFNIARAQYGWERQNSTTEYTLYSVSFVDDINGWVCGEDKTVLRTTDSGENWDSQFASPLASYFGISFCDSMYGVATGTGGVIVYTTDGGAVWNTVQEGWLLSFNAAFQIDSLWACVVGSNSIFQPMIHVTTDGWQTQNIYIFYLDHGGYHEGNLRDVYFFDSDIGCATAAVWNGDGAVVRTTDGGVNWSTVYWGGNIMTGIDFPTPDTGYAVGFGGTAVKSIDAGLSWVELTTGYGVELLDVSFGSADTGTAVGAFGYILRTVDGGASWDLQDAGLSTHLRGVQFITTDIGYAVGDSGIILFTYTGGEPPAGCDYSPGDANNDGSTNGLDVIYLVAFFKGGPEPPLTCPCGSHGDLFVGADANGSCSVNGLDVTYMVSYFKGGPDIIACPDCPPTP
ncbi:MAG: hypothetical protein JSW64_12420 [Candidatus Zixiibacteriota bacterium]|nr:MAG: hypothetical protein JSW64_12420 [candidate division Zixibacteria bacterium]